MNKKTLIFLTISFIFSAQKNYWNLGIRIISDSYEKRIVQREIVLSDDTFFAETTNLPSSNDIYALQTNYIIDPQQREKHQEVLFQGDKKNIQELIINEEYFEAAKYLIGLNNNQINVEFRDMNEYYYWSSFIYYNLGNDAEAKTYIDQISNKETDSKVLFLEALVLRNSNITESNNILKTLIKQFPEDDYAAYAYDLLNDGQ